MLMRPPIPFRELNVEPTTAEDTDDDDEDDTCPVFTLEWMIADNPQE